MNPNKDQMLLLTEGLAALHLELSKAQTMKLLRYLELLAQWGKTYNLTSILDPNEMVVRHLLDSLSIAPLLESMFDDPVHCLDIGTGAGLPGIPLSILFPEGVFTLLDSNFKKIRFVQHAQLELQLTNVQPVHQRIGKRSKLSESEPKYPLIVTRAFSSLKTIAEMCYPLLKSGGSILAMKGKMTEQEMEELKKVSPFQSISVEKIQVPYLNEERHVVVLGCTT